MKKINHWCVVCGVGYHACDTCEEVKQLRPWKSITDTLNHYKIYHVLNDYGYKKIDKNTAREMLHKVDLTGYKSWKPNVVSLIDEIMQPDVVTGVDVESDKNMTATETDEELNANTDKIMSTKVKRQKKNADSSKTSTNEIPSDVMD